MTLSKQLLLLLSTLLIIVFTVNLLLSINNARDYLVGEAEIHAQDTATSLGLSLSPYMVDETDPVIETMMNAIFDRGYYQEIKLTNIDDQELVKLTQQSDIEGVPGWFIELIPIETITAASEISSGWNISGVVHVSLTPDYAYLKLFQQAKSSFLFFCAALLLSIVLLLLILHFTLSSLKKINKMALEMADGHFVHIDELPWTTEVRNVTVSMNTMSEKLESVIKKLNFKLEDIGNKLQIDDLTGLKNKTSFDTAMKQLITNDKNLSAYLILIKLDCLSVLVKELENEAIDGFIHDFSSQIQQIVEQHEYAEAELFRILSSEFVVLANHINSQQVEQFASALSSAFEQLAQRFDKSDIAHIGIVPVNDLSDIETILLAAKEAYEQALLIGANAFYIRTLDEPAKNIEEWKKIVFHTVETEAFCLSAVGSVKNMQSDQCLMQEAFLQVSDDHKDLPVAVFISIAEKYEKIVSLDKGVMLQVIEYIQQQQLNHAMAVNLSTRTIKSNDFRRWLDELLSHHQTLAGQLVFSFSAYAVAKEISVYQDFIQFVHSLNALVMIKRFDSHSLASVHLKQLKPDYIRLTRDLGNNVAWDNEKRDFIETIKGFGDLLGIKILAESITTDEDCECLRTIGIEAASR